MKLTILTEWKIETVKPSLLLRDGVQNAGLCVYRERRILIDNTLIEDLEKVVRHELVHAYLYDTQAFLKEFYTEEDMCEFFSRWGGEIEKNAQRIAEEIRDNKE